MEHIGPNIRRLRKEAGWQEPLDAYDATGVKPHVWTNIESRHPGPQGPSLRTLQIIAAALSGGLGRKVTIDEIIDADETDPGNVRDAYEAARRDHRRRSSRAARRGKGSTSSGGR